MANQRAERVKRDVTSGRLLPEVETLEENRPSVQGTTRRVASLLFACSSLLPRLPPALPPALSPLADIATLHSPRMNHTTREPDVDTRKCAITGPTWPCLSYSAARLRQLAAPPHRVPRSPSSVLLARKKICFPSRKYPFTILTTRIQRNFASRLFTCRRA